jgi:hypothetical protein
MPPPEQQKSPHQRDRQSIDGQDAVIPTIRCGVRNRRASNSSNSYLACHMSVLLP